MRIPILALTVGAFGIGTAEFVIMGLLPDVAGDLHVSIPDAGLLVTGYAMGVVIGAPLFAIATHRLPRKTTLLLMMGFFVLGNFLSAIAPSYSILMIARVVAAFAHGTFFGVGAVVAADLVPPNKRASAIALMFTGLTLANIVGVPLGTYVGQELGWRATFWMVTALGFVSLTAVAAWVPQSVSHAAGHLKHEFIALRRPQVVIALLTTVIGFAGVFTLFTYIAPILEDVTHFSAHSVSLILLLIGVGLAIGNYLGGKFADKATMATLIGVMTSLAILLVVFRFASHDKWATIVVLFAWGIASFGGIAPMQVRVVDKAKEAPHLASSLNIGAFNLGNAGGAFLGGLVLRNDLGYDAVPLAGAAVTVLGIGLAFLGVMLDRRQTAAVAAKN